MSLTVPISNAGPEVSASASASASTSIGRGGRWVVGVPYVWLLAFFLLPFLVVLVGREQVVPLLERSKQLLFAKGDLLVGGLSLVLAGYMGWQGVEGLRLG